jgi:Zn-dependent protease
VHSARLKELAAEADAATKRGDPQATLTAWRDALDLLPPESQQFGVITQRIDELSKKISFNKVEAAGSKEGPALKRYWAGIIAVVVLLLSKGKFLLLGLSKLGTVSSMLVFLGVYWGLYGWKFALGFVVCIYIHEMGHVWSLNRYGIRASAPMFIPGIGALVRLKQAPVNVHEDARVGLAGPIWGTGAALAAWGIQLATGAPIWGAIAHTAAWLNLFNLLPIWQLDGGRGMQALARPQRWILLAVIVGAYLLTKEAMVVIVGLGAAWQAFREAPAEADWPVLGQFAALVVGLAVLSKAAALPASIGR